MAGRHAILDALCRKGAENLRKEYERNRPANPFTGNFGVSSLLKTQDENSSGTCSTLSDVETEPLACQDSWLGKRVLCGGSSTQDITPKTPRVSSKQITKTVNWETYLFGEPSNKPWAASPKAEQQKQPLARLPVGMQRLVDQFGALDKSINEGFFLRSGKSVSFASVNRTCTQPLSLQTLGAIAGLGNWFSIRYESGVDGKGEADIESCIFLEFDSGTKPLPWAKIEKRQANFRSACLEYTKQAYNTYLFNKQGASIPNCTSTTEVPVGFEPDLAELASNFLSTFKKSKEIQSENRASKFLARVEPKPQSNLPEVEGLSLTQRMQLAISQREKISGSQPNLAAQADQDLEYLRAVAFQLSLIFKAQKSQIVARELLEEQLAKVAVCSRSSSREISALLSRLVAKCPNWLQLKQVEGKEYIRCNKQQNYLGELQSSPPPLPID